MFNTNFLSIKTARPKARDLRALLEVAREKALEAINTKEPMKRGRKRIKKMDNHKIKVNSTKKKRANEAQS